MDQAVGSGDLEHLGGVGAETFGDGHAGGVHEHVELRAPQRQLAEAGDRGLLRQAASQLGGCRTLVLKRLVLAERHRQRAGDLAGVVEHRGDRAAVRGVGDDLEAPGLALQRRLEVVLDPCGDVLGHHLVERVPPHGRELARGPAPQRADRGAHAQRRIHEQPRAPGHVGDERKPQAFHTGEGSIEHGGRRHTGWIGPRRRIPEAAAPIPSMAMEKAALTHLDAAGRARMVDVSRKAETDRYARARAVVRMSPAAAARVAAGDAPKGDVAAVARIAGIQAAKRTDELIPLAHSLPLTKVGADIDVDPEAGTVTVVAEARTTDGTGVEMEALVACSVAALTVYDMVKGIEPGVVIERVELLDKTGGKADFHR